MEDVASNASLWAFVGIVAATGVAFAGWVWNAFQRKANAASVERLWAAYNATVKEFNDYKVEVAKTYVSEASLQRVEARMTSHIDEKFQSLKDLIVAHQAGVGAGARGEREGR
jgi:predicted helicase